MFIKRVFSYLALETLTGRIQSGSRLLPVSLIVKTYDRHLTLLYLLNQNEQYIEMQTNKADTHKHARAFSEFSLA